jgi:hypothetical protein
MIEQLLIGMGFMIVYIMGIIGWEIIKHEYNHRRELKNV